MPRRSRPRPCRSDPRAHHDGNRRTAAATPVRSRARRAAGRSRREEYLRRSSYRRAAALAAVVAAAFVVAYLTFGPGEPGYRVHAIFQNASQLVKGDYVQVAGLPAGKVTDLALTPDGQAELTLQIDAPTRRCAPVPGRPCAPPGSPGSPTATSTCSSAAATGRDIPDGGTSRQPTEPRRSTSTRSSTRSTPRRARRALRTPCAFLRDFQAGYEDEANAALRYLNPALSSSTPAVRRGQPRHARLRSASSSRLAKLVTDVSARDDALAGLVEPRDDGLRADVATARASAESIGLLPNVHAQVQHDVRRPARVARRPRPARRRRQAGRALEAAPAARASCARSPATRGRACATCRRTVRRAGRRQRPRRAAAPPAGARRDRDQTGQRNGKDATGRAAGDDQGARRRPRRSSASCAPTRPTSSAGSTTSRRPAPTTRSATTRAPASQLQRLLAPTRARPAAGPAALRDAAPQADRREDGPQQPLPRLARAPAPDGSNPRTSPRRTTLRPRPRSRSGHDAPRASSPCVLVLGPCSRRRRARQRPRRHRATAHERYTRRARQRLRADRRLGPALLGRAGRPRGEPRRPAHDRPALADDRRHAPEFAGFARTSSARSSRSR